MKKLFEQAGFSVELPTVLRWPNGLPTPQSKMAVPFRDLPPEDLMMMSAHVVLRAIV